MSQIRLFNAKKIITMDPNCPEATHVAVKHGKILAVGDENCAKGWGEAILDDRLAHAFLMPGFVEGHAHLNAGAIWQYLYLGYHDRIDPDGRVWSGLADIDAILDRLKEFSETLPQGAPLIAWGFDPIFLSSGHLDRHHLDRISTTRPIAVIYSNFHLLCVNSATLKLVQYDQYSDVEGIMREEGGMPTGELQEMAAMFPVMHRLDIDFRSIRQSGKALWDFAKTANRAGVTTITDLFSMLDGRDLEIMLQITGEEDFPVRIVPALAAMGDTPEKIAARALSLKARSTDRLRLGAVKIMTDGSIQARTARVKWPGYLGGYPNGLWNTAPEQIFALCKTMHRENVPMHIHVNGDEASDISIGALEAAIGNGSPGDYRYVLQHCQMMGRDQFQRCARLGVCTNIFANHIWYFGDQHAAFTIGEDSARRMDACRTALDLGVPISIHSDAPVTPLGPLFTAWCAANRKTMSGRILGPGQIISVHEALHAITLGAAYSLGLEAEIGSIETGKIADFAVLGDDPTQASADRLKDVPVLGTVSGGTTHLL